MTNARRGITLVLLAISIGLLLPGLFFPVLTIRGVLTKDGIAQVAPMMLDKGLNDDTLASIACDFHVAEAVDLTQVVVGKIPKDVFRKK